MLFDEYLATLPAASAPRKGRSNYFFDETGQVTPQGIATQSVLSAVGGFFGSGGANLANTVNQGIVANARARNFSGVGEDTLRRFDRSVGTLNAANTVGAAVGGVVGTIYTGGITTGLGTAAGIGAKAANGGFGNKQDAQQVPPPDLGYAGGQLTNLNTVFPGIRPPSLISDPLANYQFNPNGNYNFYRPQRFADGGKLMPGPKSGGVDVEKIWNTDKDILEFRRLFVNKFGEEPSLNMDKNIYDYRSAILSGARPSLDESDGLYHWPSDYKGEKHPNLIVGGVNTKTNNRQFISNLLNIPSIRQDNTRVSKKPVFADGGVIGKIQKIQNAGALKDKNYLDFVNSQADIKPSIPVSQDIDFDNLSTDISWIKKKNDTVNIDNLAPALKKYLNALPEGLRSSIVVTSGNDSSSHVPGSDHYDDNAADFRWNPNLYNYILNDGVAKRMGISTINPNHGTAKHIHLQYKSLKDGGMMNKDGAIFYKEGDPSEDIFMVDKDSGRLVGEMRYQERIFDQEASKKMEMLARKGDVRKLGQFVKSEMETHGDFTTKFAAGGPVPTKKKALELGALIDSFFGLAPGTSLQKDFSDLFPGGVKAPVLQYPNGSNELQSFPLPQNGTGIPEINNVFKRPAVSPVIKNQNISRSVASSSGSGSRSVAGGSSNPVAATGEDVKLIQQRYNEWLQNKARFTTDENGISIPNPNFKNGKLYGPDGKAVDLDLLKVDGKVGKDTEQAFALYNSDPGNVPIQYSIDKGKVGFEKETLDAFNKGGINLIRTPGEMATEPTLMGSNMASRNAGIPRSSSQRASAGAPGPGFLSTERGQTLLGNTADALRAGVSLFNAANTDVPTYELPLEYRELESDLRARRDMGFSPSEVASFNNSQGQNRLLGMSQIRSSVGGGGTSGAVLGAIGNLDRNQRDANLQFAVADNQVRQNNFSRNANFVQNEQQRDYAQDFIPRYEQAVSNRNAYLGAASASLNNIEDRNNFNRQYGENSLYGRYINSLASREGNMNQMVSNVQNTPFFNPLESPGNSFNLSERDLRTYNRFAR